MNKEFVNKEYVNKDEDLTEQVVIGGKQQSFVKKEKQHRRSFLSCLLNSSYYERAWFHEVARNDGLRLKSKLVGHLTKNGNRTFANALVTKALYLVAEQIRVTAKKGQCLLKEGTYPDEIPSGNTRKEWVPSFAGYSFDRAGRAAFLNERRSRQLLDDNSYYTRENQLITVVHTTKGLKPISRLIQKDIESNRIGVQYIPEHVPSVRVYPTNISLSHLGVGKSWEATLEGSKSRSALTDASLSTFFSSSTTHCALLRRMVDKVKPSVELVSRRKAGTTYRVPVARTTLRQDRLALRWLVQHAKNPKKHRTRLDGLVAERLAILTENPSCLTIKKSVEVAKQAELQRGNLL